VVRRFKRRPERPDACNLYKHWEMGTGDLKTGNWEPGTTAEHAYNNKIYSAPCIKRHAAHSRTHVASPPLGHPMFAGGTKRRAYHCTVGQDFT